MNKFIGNIERLVGCGRRLFFGVVVGAVGMAWAQGADTAYVPFIVNVDATVKAERNGNIVSMNVTANTVDTLKIPLETPTSVTHRSQNAQNNVPAITSNRGRVSINLPGQNYRAAEISLYSINGRRILRTNASATEAAKSISRPNLVAGVYLLTVKGANGHSFTNRLTHSGGSLNINVMFGNENFASASPAVAALSRQAAADEPEEWTITVSAPWYVDISRTLSVVAGMNLLQDVTISELMTSGTFVDDRDKQTYRWVRVGTQVWMAENLNWDGGDGDELGWCYNNNVNNCNIYGRLYDWSTTMGFQPSCNENSCAGQIQPSHRGVCPVGWHVPSDEEWTTLIDFIGDDAGTQLKATESLWNGTDDYDFSALPGGNRGTSGTFWNVDALGFWWSATETNATYTPSRYMSSTNSIVYRINLDKWSGFSLRCINDNAP